MICLNPLTQSVCSGALSILAIAGFLVAGEAIASPFQWPAHALELEEVRERGFLIVAVKDNVRPLGFRTESNELVGLEIDIARQISEEIFGTPDAVMFYPVTNPERLPALLNEEVDLVIAQLGVTEARARLAYFSTPYYVDGTSFVTHNTEIQRFSDLSGRTIAVLNHSTTIDIVRSFFPNATLVGVDSYEKALAVLEAGEADAFASDAAVLAGWVQEYPTYRLITPLISANALAIAMPRGLQYDGLHQLVNQAIRRWQRDGWLQERIRYWGLP